MPDYQIDLQVTNAQARQATASTVADLQQVQDKATAAGAAVGKAARGIDDAGKAGMGAARGLLQLGYTVDDLQYGFRGIVNNIPMLVTGMGGTAGVAGAAAVAAVAVNQLVNHWDQLSALIAVPVLQEGAAQMEALAKSTHRTAEETDQLNKSLREQAEIKSLMGRRPQEEEDRRKAFEGAVAESGGLGKLAAGLAESRMAAQGGVGAIEARGLDETSIYERFKSAMSLGTNKIIGDVASLATQGRLGGGDAQAMALARRWSQEEQGKIRAQFLAQAEADLAAGALDPAQAQRMMGQLPPAVAGKMQEALDARAKGEAQKSYKFAATDLIRRGVLDKDDDRLRAFQAGQLPLAGLGGLAPRIRAEAEANVSRAAAAEGDPKAHKLLDDQLRLMRAEVNRPMAPPKPRAGAGRP